jgi:hypothetical protein
MEQPPVRLLWDAHDYQALTLIRHIGVICDILYIYSLDISTVYT